MCEVLLCVCIMYVLCGCHTCMCVWGGGASWGSFVCGGLNGGRGAEKHADRMGGCIWEEVL